MPLRVVHDRDDDWAVGDVLTVQLGVETSYCPSSEALILIIISDGEQIFFWNLTDESLPVMASTTLTDNFERTRSVRMGFGDVTFSMIAAPGFSCVMPVTSSRERSEGRASL